MASSLLPAAPFAEERFELAAGAISCECGRAAVLLGFGAAFLDAGQLELRDPRPDGADLSAQLLCPLGRGRLKGERPQPLLDFGLEVARARDLGCDPGELQLGAMVPALEAAEAGGFLDERAALLRLAREDLLDTALTDDRAHLTAEADIGEELDEIGSAHRRAVDEVLALAASV
ncbi:MAG: hypothetical protein E6G45_07480 [Actinobacteria bacterium]|nr:MAG: hypothetical protein E6G45_07480 [Actinomycetota bacterium]